MMATSKSEGAVPAEPRSNGLLALGGQHAERLAASLPPAGQHEVTINNVAIYEKEDHVLARVTLSAEGFEEAEFPAWFHLPLPGGDVPDPGANTSRSILASCSILAAIVEDTDVAIDVAEDLHDLIGLRFRAVVGRRVRDGVPEATFKTIARRT